MGSRPVALVVGTTEIPDFRVFLIEMIPQVVAAIGTDQQAGKHIFLAVACFTLTGLAALLLNFFPVSAGENRLMYVLENRPVLLGVGNPFLQLKRL